MLLEKRDKVRNILVLTLLLSVWAGAAHSVPPPPDAPIPVVPTCRVNSQAAQARLAAARAAPFFQVPLSPTTSYVLVIRVDYSDQNMSKSKSQTEQFMENMKKFYLENSYGVLSISATVTNRTTGGNAGSQGSYRMSSALSSYAQGICSNFNGIVKDAVTAANTDYDFSDARPDIVGNQPYNHIMVYHAGVGAETASDSGCQTDNIWSVFAPTVPASSSQSDGVLVPLVADGVIFSGATIVPESELQGIDPLGVICHEYGHQLGLPDLYKTSAQSVEGKWSLMDSGVYTGSPAGSNPSHLDAWSKQFLGFFSNPQTVTAQESGTTLTLELALSSANAYVRVPISGVTGVDGNKEYFLIERRARASVSGKNYDDGLPLGSLLEGTLIWHVDDSIASDPSRLEANSINNGSPNFGVDLVEAGGSGSVATTTGKESDPFPGSESKTIFAAPHSNSFSGAQSGITVAGFSGSQLVVKKAFSSDSVEVTRAINFPNPGGPSYSQKSGAPAGTVTTVVLNTSRAAQKVQLSLYDLSGALVREVSSSLIKANGTAIANRKFVYEYDWDGKNDEGETAAPGVYLYRFKVDDSLTETGKLVLIR
ncbi:MAG: M6 family metalloprotease domain-containing protein [Elusimicrobia bacterium]|nr:M6 family metalloprotease domain-containing protein [Elusimicrobiota bacterium]